MKSKIVKFLTIAALLCAAFSFIACGGNGAGGGDDAGGGNSAGGIPSSEQVSAKLKTMDYDIVVEVAALGESAMSMEMAKKGNTYWFDIGVMAMAYKLEGNSCYYYMKMEDESGNMTWMYVGEDSADTIEQQMENSFKDSLFYASNLPTDLVKSGSAVVAERTCTKYTWSDSAYGATVSETVYIDNETGLCLKLEASDSVNGQSEGASFEVKSFKTGNDVVAPVLPAPVSQA